MHKEEKLSEKVVLAEHSLLTKIRSKIFTPKTLCFMRNLVDYLLRGKKQLFFLAFFTLVFSSLVIAQNRVTGKVTGPDGKPVFGATVAVKGTNIATTTTTNGSYAVTMPHNSTVLVFSYIGFEV